MSEVDAALISSFERDGFVNGGSIANEASLAELRAEVERCAAPHLNEMPPPADGPIFKELGHDAHTRHYEIVGIAGHSAPFAALIRNRRLLDMAAALMQAQTLRLWYDVVQFKPAREGGPVNWHQDGYYHMLVGGVKHADRVLSAWVALDDANQESGCMWMAPGTHRWGVRQPHLQRFRHLRERDQLAAIEPLPKMAQSDWREPVACPVKAGEVHFHHAHTWHGSPYNRSNHHRRGYTIFIMADGAEAPPAQEPLLLYRRAPKEQSA